MVGDPAIVSGTVPWLWALGSIKLKSISWILSKQSRMYYSLFALDCECDVTSCLTSCLDFPEWWCLGCCEETAWPRQFIKESIYLWAYLEGWSMTIIPGSVAAGRHAWCWSNSWELTSWFTDKESKTGPGLGFWNLQAHPNDMPPPMSPYFLILAKQFQQLGTKHSNTKVCDHHRCVGTWDYKPNKSFLF